MLTFAEELALLEAQVAQVSNFTVKQFGDLIAQIAHISAMTGYSAEEITQMLKNTSTQTGASIIDVANTLKDLVTKGEEEEEEFSLEEEGENNQMDYNYRYKNLGNYKGLPVHEMTLNDYLTIFIDREADDKVYYVITDNLSVILKGWIIGRINAKRNNIAEVTHTSVHAAFGSEITKRAPRNLGNKMNRNATETLISARPTIALLVKQGEDKLAEQVRASRELVESLKR